MLPGARALALLLVLAACDAPTAQLEPRRVACSGPHADVLDRDLPRTLGVWTDEFGRETSVTRLFAQEPARTIIEDNMRSIIEGEQSDWRGPYGLSLGMSSQDVARLNGGVFEVFWSSDHDFVRSVSWKDGRLSATEPCGLFSVHFEPRDRTALSAIAGNALHSSDSAALREADLYVSRIDFGYIPEE